MDHRRVLLLSMLYPLVRCLLDLIAVLVRGDLGEDAQLPVLRQGECSVAPTDLRGPLHARRPGVTGCFISAAAAPTLGRGLSGHSRHDPGLAPQAGLAAMGLLGTPPAWAPPDRTGDQESGDPHGH